MPTNRHSNAHRLLGNVREDGSDSTSCFCFKLKMAIEDTKVSPAGLAEIRRHVYAPCWQCALETGCVQCKPERPSSCEKCGAYINREAFCMYGDRLPEDYRNRHPTGWRLLYYALHGIPEGFQMYVRLHLRDEQNFKFVSRVANQLGLPPEHIEALDPTKWQPTNPWEGVKGFKGVLHPDDEVALQETRAAAYAKRVPPLMEALPPSMRRASLRIVHDAPKAPPLSLNDDPFFSDKPVREPGEEG